MNPDYPLFLDLTGRPVLVVGGGPVATRRARSLVRSGAEVRVIAPWATEDLRDAAARGELRWEPREFADDDIADAWLVQACSGDVAVDARVVDLAESNRIWSVRASDAAWSPAWTAGSVRTDDGVQVAVNGGRDPGRAKALLRAVAEIADEGLLPLRRHRRGGGPVPSPAAPGHPDTGTAGPESPEHVSAPTPAARGRVFLVGGGPGDPDLMTVRARRLLSLADVVVTDRLAPVAALARLDDDVAIIDVGKAPGRHALPQTEINALLVDRAARGEVVVRLKGGDPFVLGRGGEEALACLAAGVDVEVVPGVTSAVSVPAAAGIPVTHRGMSTSALILSAHDGPAEVIRRSACTPPDTTLVLLMGVRHLAETSAALIAAGRPADLPAAVVAEGWTRAQQVVTGTLADIAARADRAGVGSPAVIVIGPVASLHDQLGLLGRPSPDAGHGALP